MYACTVLSITGPTVATAIQITKKNKKPAPSLVPTSEILIMISFTIADSKVYSRESNDKIPAQDTILSYGYFNRSFAPEQQQPQILGAFQMQEGILQIKENLRYSYKRLKN